LHRERGRARRERSRNGFEKIEWVGSSEPPSPQVQLQVFKKKKIETCTEREGELGEREVEMGLRKLSGWVPQNLLLHRFSCKSVRKKK
jgi:hypothetical protein